MTELRAPESYPEVETSIMNAVLRLEREERLLNFFSKVRFFGDPGLISLGDLDNGPPAPEAPPLEHAF